MMQWDIELRADAARILQVFGGRAIALVVLPVRHVQGVDVVAFIS